MTVQVTVALEALRDPDGLLRIERVVEAASDPASPLHERFEWDDGHAAHRYRLDQARALIRAQNIPLRVGPLVVRTPVYVSVNADQHGAYQRLDEVPHSSDLAHSILMRELTQVSAVLGRARRIAVVLELESEIDELLATLNAVSTKAGKKLKATT